MKEKIESTHDKIIKNIKRKANIEKGYIAKASRVFNAIGYEISIKAIKLIQ